MTWHPITKEEFDRVMQVAITEIPTNLLPTYRRYAIEPVEQRCFRSSKYGIEHVFVVACVGQRQLIFDDVEGEFAVGVPDTDGILRRWVLYGPLDVALQGLSEAVP